MRHGSTCGCAAHSVVRRQAQVVIRRKHAQAVQLLLSGCRPGRRHIRTVGNPGAKHVVCDRHLHMTRMRAMVQPIVAGHHRKPCTLIYSPLGQDTTAAVMCTRTSFSPSSADAVRPCKCDQMRIFRLNDLPAWGPATGAEGAPCAATPHHAAAAVRRPRSRSRAPAWRCVAPTCILCYDSRSDDTARLYTTIYLHVIEQVKGCACTSQSWQRTASLDGVQSQPQSNVFVTSEWILPSLDRSAGCCRIM